MTLAHAIEQPGDVREPAGHPVAPAATEPDPAQHLGVFTPKKMSWKTRRLAAANDRATCKACRVEGALRSTLSRLPWWPAEPCSRVLANWPCPRACAGQGGMPNWVTRTGSVVFLRPHGYAQHCAGLRTQRRQRGILTAVPGRYASGGAFTLPSILGATFPRLQVEGAEARRWLRRVRRLPTARRRLWALCAVHWENVPGIKRLRDVIERAMPLLNRDRDLGPSQEEVRTSWRAAQRNRHGVTDDARTRRAQREGDAQAVVVLGKAFHYHVDEVYQSKVGDVVYGTRPERVESRHTYSKGWHKQYGPARGLAAAVEVLYQREVRLSARQTRGWEGQQVWHTTRGPATHAVIHPSRGGDYMVALPPRSRYGRPPRMTVRSSYGRPPQMTVRSSWIVPVYQKRTRDAHIGVVEWVDAEGRAVGIQVYQIVPLDAGARRYTCVPCGRAWREHGELGTAGGWEHVTDNDATYDED